MLFMERDNNGKRKRQSQHQRQLLPVINITAPFPSPNTTFQMPLYFFFLFSFIFFSLSPPLLCAAPAPAPDYCKPTRCRRGGPLVQYPFTLRNRQPQAQDCGYPGFELHCSDNSETVLDLQISINFTVKRIGYLNRKIVLSDPGKCLPQKLQTLNLTTSPFQFPDSDVEDYILFNCTVTKQDLTHPVPCLRDPRYQFYAIPFNSYMDTLSLVSCTNYHNISAVPSYVFSRNDISLLWSEPNCTSVCETQGRRCVPKEAVANGTAGFQCVEKPKSHAKEIRRYIIAGLAVGSFLMLIAIACLIFLIVMIIKDRENRKKIEGFLEDYKALKPTRFGYSDIRKITNQFSEKLGEGGYGVVYKGKLSSEISVAVKVLNNSKENGEEFVNEVSTIGRIHHVNVVRLVGFCAEGFRRVVVFEFLPNDSLEKFIFQTETNRTSLGLEKLQDIAQGIAKGIEYLHQGCDQQILHFDIKPRNILLDQNFSPKICDFGMAKLCSKEQSAVTMTAARGTMGYIAPELLSRTFGRVSYKSDVYSFGMLLLEMVGGRKNVDLKINNSQVYFPQWVYNHLNLGDEFWVHVEEGYDDQSSIARKLTIVGLHCIQWYPADRPSMKDVVLMLEGDGSDLLLPPNPFPSTNATNLVAGLPPQALFQIDLPPIDESE